jgi:hypothetical protein
MAATVVGRVAELWRYPVKSMAGEPLEEAEVSWHGVAGDRRWAFVRGDVPRSGFPWLTLRENSAMIDYRPAFADPGRPDDSRTLVRTPAGDELDVVDPALAAELGDGLRALKQDRGVFDSAPLSVISMETIGALGERVGTPLDPRRFRPNIVVETGDGVPFAEDTWVGSTVIAGGVGLRVDRRDERCVIVNLDPVTGERDPAVLKTIGRERQARLGVYGAPVQPGRVRVGDPVSLV